MAYCNNTMMRSKNKTVKSEGERNWYSRVISKIISKPKPATQRKIYHKATEEQIRKVFKLKRENPKLSLFNIGNLVGVTEGVADYWLSMNEEDVIANFKARRGRRTVLDQRQERVNQTKRKKTKPVKPTTQAPEISLSTFTKLSEIKGQEILEKIEKTNKYPTQEKASPKWKGTVPSQAVASEEEWKEEDRNYKIGKATMYKAIKAKDDKKKLDKKLTEKFKNEEKRKDRLQKEHKEKLAKGTLKLHLPSCPSCNRKSELTIDQYRSLCFKEHLKRKEYAINKQKKQLDQRAEQLDQMEKESIGNVAERAKEGTKLCKVCNEPLEYSQSTRTFGRHHEYYCQDHEPKEVN